MGTAATQLAILNSQTLGAKTIFGSFVVLLIILFLQVFMKHNHAVSKIMYFTFVGIVLVGSLVLLAIAIDSLAVNGGTGI